MELMNDVGYVIASSYRTKTLKSIAKSPKIPTQIAKDCDIVNNHISKTLNELKEHNLINCINPEMRKGRVYRITEYGQDVLEQLIAIEN